MRPKKDILTCRDGMRHYNPLLYDSWNKKKKHKAKEKQKDIRKTMETWNLTLTGFLFLHHSF